VFCPSVFTIDGHEVTDSQFIVLPHFKSSDTILGSSALKQLVVVIHPSINTLTMGNFSINCNRESRYKNCMIVDCDKMDQINVIKQARNKKNPIVVFLISLHFAEDLTTIKSDFGEQFDQQLKQLITEFAGVMEEP
jgi:hypothetical protein